MRPVSIRVHNFRTLADIELAVTPYLLLVGPNNSGKSNVFDAVRVFYDKDVKFDESRDFPKFATDDSESWVEIQFRPTDQELADLKDEYRLDDGTFRVRKYLRSSELDQEGKTKTGIYAYVGGQLSDSRFYGAKNVQQAKLGEVVFIPAVSPLGDQTKLSGPSPLRDLINAVLTKVLRASPAYARLQDAFTMFGDGLKAEQTETGQSLEALEREITAEIKDWNTAFELTVEPIPPDVLLKSLIGHRLQDGKLGKPEESTACGQGFQRRLVFALIRVAARHAAPSSTSARKEFSPQLTWFLFEEPEAFLSPPQIDALDADLRLISLDPSSAVTITSHNPQFVSRSMQDLPSLVRLCRPTAHTQARQLDQATLDGILAANQLDLEKWAKAGLATGEEDLQIDMEAIKYALWINPLRSRAFFANHVLLVEGATEVALLTHLLETGKIPQPEGGLFVLDCLGKYNIHRFMNLLGALGIPHSVLHDHDGGKPRDIEIRQTIDACRCSCTAGVDHFDQDLESFLGIPPAGRIDRKPQHVMWHLSHGTVAPERLQALSLKVQALCRST